MRALIIIATLLMPIYGLAQITTRYQQIPAEEFEPIPSKYKNIKATDHQDLINKTEKLIDELDWFQLSKSEKYGTIITIAPKAEITFAQKLDFMYGPYIIDLHVPNKIYVHDGQTVFKVTLEELAKVLHNDICQTDFSDEPYWR